MKGSAIAPFALGALVLAASVRLFAGNRPGPEPAGAPGPADVLAAHLDPSMSPRVDFFQYANGGWLAKNPIPASESGWGIGYLVQDEIYDRLRKIDEDAAASSAPAGSETRKIGDFWKTAMDEALCDRQGLAPLQAELARIDAIRDVSGVVDEAFAQLPLHTDAFFSFSIYQDQKNSDVMAVQLEQGGLGLPDRDFYFNTDENSVRVRAEYGRHLERMLRLVRGPQEVPPQAGERVLAFETALAKASRKLEDLRDPEKNYNKMTVEDVTSKLTPSIDWKARLSALGLSGADTVIVGQPEFFTALEELWKTTPLEDLKDYLRFHLVSSYAEFAGKDVADEDFAFYGKVLNGQEEQRPRWKRALDAEQHAMGMVLGKLYVGKYFTEAAKTRYSDLVEAVRTAFRARIEKLDWMGEETKRKALEKLARMTKKVGYPDKWKDYSTLQIGTDSWIANMMSASRWRFQDRLSKFGKPVDRTEWEMTPQTYNAYYNPSNNEIVLPAAAFIVPGVPDADLDDAVVYGYAAASTIGHEMTHGFDDEGRQFDADGNLRDWWTKQDEERFNARAERVVKEFDAFEPLPHMHINGKACLGENIADLGGVVIGLDAFEKTDEFKSGKEIAGLSPLQRYFLGYALSWLYEQRRENLARRLLSDVHSPPKWRVNGPLANVPAFYRAFGVKAGDPMWRSEENRARIW
jgi:putative endopeptidase